MNNFSNIFRYLCDKFEEKNMRYKILLVFLPIFIFTACLDKAEREQDLLKAYLEENNITEEPKSSGLYYIEITEGDGDAPKAGSFVSVHYEGRLIDGEVFDTSYDSEEPFTFVIGAGQVIRGWEEGVSYMKEGGKAQLIIPSHLGYGSYERDKIPAYSTLIFDIELISVGNQK